MKKMHYNFPRTLSATLLLIAMTMFCLQAKADGITFTAATDINSAKEYDNKTALLNNETKIATASISDMLVQIAKDFNLQQDSWGALNSSYLRWLVIDKTTSTFSMESSSDWTVKVNTTNAAYDVGKYGYVWACNYDQNDVSNMSSATFTYTGSLKLSELKDKYQLVCLYCKSRNNCIEYTDGVVSAIKEPTIDAIIRFNIMTEEDAKNAFTASTTITNTLKSTIVVDNITGEQTLNLYSMFAYNNNSNNKILDIFPNSLTSAGSYVRIYLTKNGEMLSSTTNPFTSDNYDYTDNGLIIKTTAQTSTPFYSYSYFSANNMKALIDNLKLTIPDATEGDEYGLVCLLSKGVEERVGNYVLNEPDIDVKLEIKILSKDKALKSFTPSSTVLAEANQSVLVSDFKDSQIVNLYTLFADKIKAAFSDGVTDPNSYVHFYLQDSDGKIVDINSSSNKDKILLSPANGETGNYTLTYNGYFINSTGKNNRKFYNNYNNTTSLNESAFQSLLNGITLTIPDQTYTLVCRLSKSNEDRAINADGTESDYVLKEPDIDLQLNVNFISTTDAANFEPFGDLTDAKTFETTYIIDKNAETATINLYRQHYQQVRSTLTDEQDWTGIKYLHWYFRDKDTKKPLTTMVKGTFAPSTARTDITTVDNTKGYFMYNESGITSVKEVNYKFTLNKTNETSWDWSKVQAVCVITDDADGIDMLTSDGTTYVKDEPTNLKYALIVNFQNSDTYTQDFKHYKGYAYKDVASKTETWAAPSPDNYQDVHVWEYDMYVKPGESITLDLPIDYGHGNPYLEPCGYFRWYDYGTDLSAKELSFLDNTKLKEISKDDKSFGFFAFNLDLIEKTVSNATFTAPSSDWEGSDIACDVSRYLDGMDESRDYMYHEPTLSVRYLFHIHPASEIAGNLKKALEDSKGTEVYEDYGYVSFGMEGSSNGDVNLRVNLHDVTDYFFYPYNYVNQPIPTTYSNGFGSDIYKANSIKWYAYDATGTYYKELGNPLNNGRMCTFNLANANGTYTKLGTKETKECTFSAGDIINVIAFAFYDAEHMCPIANFKCIPVANSSPMTVEDITKNNIQHRTTTWLNNNFTESTTLSFDEDENAAGIKGLTNLSAPTNPIDNMTSLPSVWTRRHYGFVYSGLYDQYDKRSYDEGGGYRAGLGCKHGEYGIYKTINHDNISLNGTSTGYTIDWYNTNKLEDRTFYLKNGKEYGYFLYVDASEEARPICSKGFGAKLCVGSTVVFSAAVANMTDASGTKPQLMFKLYGAKKDEKTGEYTREKIIHSFASCDFNSVNAKELGKWYQVYANITLLQNSGVENYENFIVEVDNYAKDTQGADFAIDDIRFYTRTPKLLATQKSPACDDTEGSTGKMICKMKYESLLNEFGTSTNWTSKKVRFRVCKSSDKSVVEGLSVYKTGCQYGEIDFYRTVPTEGDNAKNYQTIDDALYFILMDDVELPVGQYYVSVSLESGVDEKNNPTYTSWGEPNGNAADRCSVYSEDLTIGQQSITISSGKTDAETKVVVPCSGSAEATLNATLVLPDPVNGGDYNVSNVSFDWFIGSKSEYGEAAYNGTKLSVALSAMRSVSNYATGNYTSAPEASGNYTADHKAVIDYFINNNKLYLGYSSITRNISASEGASGKLHLFMIPLVTTVTINGVKVEVCTDGTEASIETESNGPQLVLGFPDVVYPEGNRSLRLGLCQLDEMEKTSEKNGKTLVVPVNSFANSDGTTTTFNLDIYNSNNVLKIVDTNDPTWTVGTGMTIGTVSDLQQKTVNFHFDKTKYSSNVFHEGYWYDLKFEFYDKSALKEGETPCYGSVIIRMKIVPEFVTWTGSNTSNYSNWNNDENWTRSKRGELYKDSYANYGEENTDFSSLSQQNSFVPMKFTKVTIPTMDTYQYANLNAIEYDVTTGILKSDNLSNGESHKATEDIEYDILVEELPADNPTEYTCEKFYGNTCDQVYFKPSAELRYQQHLIYNKAWVEKEMEPKKWYMITVPLCDIWAGDMYLPIQDGRQETEAFKDITFDTNTYNRAKYSVYQRSWDNADATQVHSDTETYKAAIDYKSWGETTDVVTNNWSHVYNKLDEQYTGENTFVLNGFALKAGDGDVTSTSNALFRLPKADTQYNYYKYDGTTVDGSAVNTSKSNSGKLIFDKDNSADVTQTLKNASDNNTLYIVSNPYMASLDMQKFFAENTGLSPSYWTIIGDNVKGEPVNTDDNSTVYPSIAPLQSFLVSKASSSDITSVKFTTAMITLGKPIAFTTNVKASAPQQKVRTGVVNVPSPTLWITATNEFGSSNARVVENVDADEDFVDSEDLKMIYDSNIADLPSVYTVAGDEAVSVNKLPSLELLPIGVVSDNSSNVSIKVSGLESFENPLYLLDAKEAVVTPISSDSELTIEPNVHGRYYLTTRSDITAIEDVNVTTGVKAYSPAIHTLVVSALGSTITSVKVFSTDGRVIAEEHVDGQSATLTTISGVNVVKVTTADNNVETIKVNVR